jgi:hypothetical protein
VADRGGLENRYPPEGGSRVRIPVSPQTHRNRPAKAGFIFSGARPKVSCETCGGKIKKNERSELAIEIGLSLPLKGSCQ